MIYIKRVGVPLLLIFIFFTIISTDKNVYNKPLFLYQERKVEAEYDLPTDTDLILREISNPYLDIPSQIVLSLPERYEVEEQSSYLSLTKEGRDEILVMISTDLYFTDLLTLRGTLESEKEKLQFLHNGLRESITLEATLGDLETFSDSNENFLVEKLSVHLKDKTKGEILFVYTIKEGKGIATAVFIEEDNFKSGQVSLLVKLLEESQTIRYTGVNNLESVENLHFSKKEIFGETFRIPKEFITYPIRQDLVLLQAPPISGYLYTPVKILFVYNRNDKNEFQTADSVLRKKSTDIASALKHKDRTILNRNMTTTQLNDEQLKVIGERSYISAQFEHHITSILSDEFISLPEITYRDELYQLRRESSQITILFITPTDLGYIPVEILAEQILQ